MLCNPKMLGVFDMCDTAYACICAVSERDLPRICEACYEGLLNASHQHLPSATKMLEAGMLMVRGVSMSMFLSTGSPSGAVWRENELFSFTVHFTWSGMSSASRRVMVMVRGFTSPLRSAKVQASPAQAAQP